jgi:hypothetical protein
MTALVYIEYMSRNPGVSLEAFRHVVGSLQTGWESHHEADDVMLLNIARTWRVGPEPEYLTVWLSRAGLRRLDEWERLYEAGEEAPWNVPFRLAGSMDSAGCYEPLIEPRVGTAGRYYAEYFDFAPAASRDDVRAFFAERADRYPESELTLLVDRIGTLGPEPRGLAVWSCAAWSGIDGLVRELDAVVEPVRHVRGGLYADLGREIR